MKLFKFFATLNLLLSPIAISAHAQADRGGNGGDPNELAEFTGRNGEHLQSWYGVKQDLIRGLENDQHLSLNLKNISADEFKTKALHSLKTVKVEFNDQKIEINGVQRPCRNFNLNGDARIECNTANYVSSMSNYSSEEQYQLVAHEYLGAAGIEPNTDGLSDYPISSQISKSLQQVTVKKWAVSSEGVVPGIHCEIENRPGMFKNFRKITLQAHMYGARLIALETPKGIQEVSGAILEKIRHYGIMRGVQDQYKMMTANKNGNFLKFSKNGEIANGAFKLDIAPGLSMMIQATVYDKMNRESDVYLLFKNGEKVSGYNTSMKCEMVNYDDKDFNTHSGSMYMFSALGYSESKTLLRKNLQWFKNASEENEYLATPERLQSNNLEF